MDLRVTYKDGRVEEYTNVRYTSTYPELHGGPRIMRVEFFADCGPALTLALDKIYNTTTIDQAMN